MAKYYIEYKDGSSITFETKEPISTSFLFETLVSKPKWYDGFYTKQAAYEIKARHIMQNLTEQYYTELFAKFGYTKGEAVWFPKETFKDNSDQVNFIPHSGFIRDTDVSFNFEACEHHISGKKCLKCGRRF
jgi:hypothetical protein